MSYKYMLLKAFPEALANDVIAVSDILPLNIHAVTLSNDQIVFVNDLIQPSAVTVKFNSDLLNIPSRIHFNEPDPYMVSQLTHTQKIILHCIYLRHHNGYLRQSRLEELAGVNEDWIVPHTLQLLGDYVLKIIQTLDKIVTDENIQYYRQFVRDNPKYWQQTVSRMISYWDCYYRRKYFRDSTQEIFPRLKDYPGRQVVDRLEDRNCLRMNMG